ncbi:helix-turn-helix transcriptional regulator [Bartonella sp. DGB2]|uniref:LexA family transcriptional regulator n=1 Tax=Bartonella sp. DGB2 TaxID=3388426 RepID=UPI00398FE804
MENFVVKLENELDYQNRYNRNMTLNLIHWLTEALSSSGLSQATLAKKMSESLNRSIDRAAVNKMLKGTRDISARELLAISKITGSQLPPICLVPLIGSVGAGGDIVAIDCGCLEEVEAPPTATANTVALRVIGDSMFPAIENGSILFYSQHVLPETMINNRAIVKTVDGNVYVKVLRGGREKDKWVLSSLNGKYADIIDVQIEWCSPIDWIKPPRP